MYVQAPSEVLLLVVRVRREAKRMSPPSNLCTFRAALAATMMAIKATRPNLSVSARVSVEVAPPPAPSTHRQLSPCAWHSQPSWRNVGPADGDAPLCSASGAIGLRFNSMAIIGVECAKSGAASSNCPGGHTQNSSLLVASLMNI